LYWENALSYAKPINEVASSLLSPSPKKLKCVPSAGKVMMTVFWDARGVILVDFLPKGETINASRYQDTLNKLAHANLLNIILHHDNARTHTAHVTTAIADKGWSCVVCTVYSPDLAYLIFYLFNPLKE
jgi:hypothetical protein